MRSSVIYWTPLDLRDYYDDPSFIEKASNLVSVLVQRLLDDVRLIFTFSRTSEGENTYRFSVHDDSICVLPLADSIDSFSGIDCSDFKEYLIEKHIKIDSALEGFFGKMSDDILVKYVFQELMYQFVGQKYHFVNRRSLVSDEN